MKQMSVTKSSYIGEIVDERHCNLSLIPRPCRSTCSLTWPGNEASVLCAVFIVALTQSSAFVVCSVSM